MKKIKRFGFIVKFWRFIPFFKDFLVSKEVKISQKVFWVSFIVLYMIIPFDFIPDFLAGIGIVDDLMIMSLIIGMLLKKAPPSLKEKYKLLL